MEQNKQNKEKIPYRGYNLLEDRIPSNRSCNDAGIPPNFCTCMENKALPRYTKKDKNYHRIFAEIFTYLKANFHSCLKLKSLLIEEDEIQALSINGMIRQGWRQIDP